MSEPVATPRAGPLDGVAAFYEALWTESRAAAERWHLAVMVEIAMIVAWFAIRTIADVDGRTYALWVVTAGLLALVAPMSGLVVFIATSAFFEPDSFARSMSPRELVVIPLAAGVLLRVAGGRFRWRPEPSVWVALLLLGGTALGLATTAARFSEDVAWHAARSWVGNMSVPVILLVAAAWTGRRGDLRALITACVTAVAVAAVCLVEYVAPGTVSEGRFEWVGFWKDFGARLAGTIPSPNALSAQLIVPTMVMLAAVVLARDWRIRAVALAGVIPLAAAHYLTYSRAPFVVLYIFVVIVAWRFRRIAGIAVLVVGLAVGALVLPAYLQVRTEAVPGSPVGAGSILVASDAHRFRAWGAAIRMTADEPFVGQGYLAYKERADDFGDPVLGSPHNEWLRLFAEGGVLVGLIGLAFIGVTWWSLTRVPGWLGTGILAGFAGYVVAATFNNPLLFVRVSAIVFPVIGVGLALASIARTREPVATDGDGPPDPERLPAPAAADSARSADTVSASVTG